MIGVISPFCLDISCFAVILNLGIEEKNMAARNHSNSKSGEIRAKFEIYGEVMIEKTVKVSGNSGRIYLPPDWVGHKVKIIKID
ncbi:MAG: DUF2080 family transposase-associated protein [Dehalococcoidia bacterium]